MGRPTQTCVIQVVTSLVGIRPHVLGRASIYYFSKEEIAFLIYGEEKVFLFLRHSLEIGFEPPFLFMGIHYIFHIFNLQNPLALLTRSMFFLLYISQV